MGMRGTVAEKDEQQEQQQEPEQEQQDQPIQSAVMVEFNAPNSANVQFRLIGSVSASQLLLAAEYLRLVAEREIHSAWMVQAQTRAAEQAQLQQIKQVIAQPKDRARKRRKQ